MKNLAFLFLTIAAISFGCKGSSSGLTVAGTVNGASAMQVFFEKVSLNATAQPITLTKVDADASGKFSLALAEALQPGIYRLRIGEQQIFLVLDGTEHELTVSGDLANLNRFQYEVQGCQNCLGYRDLMQKLVNRQAQPTDVQAYIESAPNPLSGVLVAMQAFGGNAAFLEMHNKAKAKLEAAYPNSEYVKDYAAFITSTQQVQQPSSSGGFTFYEEAQRQPAPDIKLPSPDGKEYSLSDLKGQVVLLDFWASWCRPCRMENPNVVKTYNAYKDKGFTVFSVSLDGIDSRTAQMIGDDAAKLEEARKNEIRKWKDAITQDGLVWPTHVSDLKKWECAPAQLYGVSSIPRAFLIDKDGKIAATGMRGEQLEETLKKLL